MPIGALGAAAPAAWLVLERAASLLGLVAAWRLARPSGGRLARAARSPPHDARLLVGLVDGRLVRLPVHPHRGR